MNTFILQDWRLFVNVLSYYSCPPALLPPGDLSQAPKREAGVPPPPGRPSVPPAARVAASMTPPSVSPSPAARSAVAAFAPGAAAFYRGRAKGPPPQAVEKVAQATFSTANGEPPEKRAARLYLPYKIASAPYRAAIPARHTRCRNRAQRFSSTSGWNWTPSTSGPASMPSMVPSLVAAHWIRPGAKPLTR